MLPTGLGQVKAGKAGPGRRRTKKGARRGSLDRRSGRAYSDEPGHDLHESDDPLAEQDGPSDFLLSDFLVSPLRA